MQVSSRARYRKIWYQYIAPYFTLYRGQGRHSFEWVWMFSTFRTVIISMSKTRETVCPQNDAEDFHASLEHSTLSMYLYRLNASWFCCIGNRKGMRLKHIGQIQYCFGILLGLEKIVNSLYISFSFIISSQRYYGLYFPLKNAVLSTASISNSGHQ